MEKIKGTYKLEVKPGVPLEMSDSNGPLDTTGPLANSRVSPLEFSNILDTFVAYKRELERLLRGPLAHLNEIVPVYWREKANVWIFRCKDGLLVRYDVANEEKGKVLISNLESSIVEFGPLLSEQVIQIHDSAEYTSDPNKGITLTFQKHEATGTVVPLWAMKFVYDVVLKEPESLPQNPQRPFCLISLENVLDIEVHGLELPTDVDVSTLDVNKPPASSRPFVSLARVRLPVGWECIQIYPFYTVDDWKPEYASLWAERDLLAFATAYHAREEVIRTLDPYADARLRFSRLFQQFQELLDSPSLPEEVLQKFLKENPQLLCPSYVKMWPKLKLGKTVTDFVFREAVGEYLLVELELSSARLFRKDGHMTAEVNHALGQITDWKRYIEENISTVRNELGLEGISSNPKSLVVIGRSYMLSNALRKKLSTFENERPRTKIFTYDDVLANARVVVENLLGPIPADQNSRVIYPQLSRE